MNYQFQFRFIKNKDSTHILPFSKRKKKKKKMARTKTTKVRKPMGRLVSKPSAPQKSRAAAKAPTPKREGEKKPHRFRPGTVRFRQVLKRQKETKLQLSKSPLRRLIREEMTNTSTTEALRIGKDAAIAIQMVFEASLQRVARAAAVIAYDHDQPHIRVTEKDINLAIQLTDTSFTGN
jgi:histone H3